MTAGALVRHRASFVVDVQSTSNDQRFRRSTINDADAGLDRHWSMIVIICPRL